MTNVVVPLEYRCAVTCVLQVTQKNLEPQSNKCC